MSSDIKPHRGSERVKAWVYAVLNPLIDSLRRETALLKSGNLSWRVDSRRCEYIRPIAELIDADQRPNLEDFLAEHPTLSGRFSQHDSALTGLEDATTEYVRELLKSADFQRRVGQCLDDYESRLRPSNPTYPDLRDIPGRIAEYVAEFIVNSSKSLPRHYSMHPFWKEYVEQFASFFAGLAEVTRYNIKGRSRALLTLSEQLVTDLESLRLNLVREFDIPAAPIEPARSALQENAPSRFR